jgi:hypothetical protein
VVKPQKNEESNVHFSIAKTSLGRLIARENVGRIIRSWPSFSVVLKASDPGLDSLGRESEHPADNPADNAAGVNRMVFIEENTHARPAEHPNAGHLHASRQILANGC